MSYGCKAYLSESALKHNFLVVKQYAPLAKIVAMIKANGYGHGALWVAQHMRDADAFGVARLAEALALRRSGFNQTIVLVEGILNTDDLRLAIEYHLDIVIHDFHQVALLENLHSSGKLNIWIKIDTGMGRIGFLPEHFSDVYSRIYDCACVNRAHLRVMTHFACADDRQDIYTHQQIERFEQVAHHLTIEKSLANSGGIMGWPESHAQWVRPGIMLYGISPFMDSTGEEVGLQPVMTLKAELIAVRTQKEGDHIGYGGTFICPHAMTVGVIAAGYGDGYPRYISPGCPVLFQDQYVPIVGRVSMDMMVVDLSSISAPTVGEMVTLWGEGLPVETIAHWAKTSPYELLTGITNRVEVFFIEE